MFVKNELNKRKTDLMQIPPEFDWDSSMQGWLLSSFFYGYILTQLPGGWLAARIGGNRVFGIGIAATAFLTLITPFLVNTSVYLFLAVRIIEGIFEVRLQPLIKKPIKIVNID